MAGLRSECKEGDARLSDAGHSSRGLGGDRRPDRLRTRPSLANFREIFRIFLHSNCFRTSTSLKTRPRIAATDTISSYKVWGINKDCKKKKLFPGV